MDPPSIPAPPTTPARAPDVLDRVYALHAFHAENADELSFEQGEWVDVVERDDEFGDGWWRGRVVKKVGEAEGEAVSGLFPASYVGRGGDVNEWLEMQRGGPGIVADSKPEHLQVLESNSHDSTGTPLSIPKSPSRPASIRSQPRAASPEGEIPPVPALSREYSNVEREQDTGLALSIPPAEPSPGQKEEPDYRAIHKADAEGTNGLEGEHQLGRRDEGVVGTAERAAEAAMHPEENGKTAVSDPSAEFESNGDSTDKAPVTDGSKDASFVSLDSDDDEQEEHATSTRTRLAEAARAENERREQAEQTPESVPGSTAHSRTGSVQYSGVRMANGRPNWTSGAGLPAGLIYSDESDSEGSSDDELGVGLGTSRKTSGAASVTKSPKMSRDERDRRVFGDDLGDTSLMERVKNVAGVAGAGVAGVAGGIGLTGMRQSQHASPKQPETHIMPSPPVTREPVIPAVVTPTEPLRVPGSISLPTPPRQATPDTKEISNEGPDSRRSSALAPPADIQPILSRTESKTPVPVAVPQKTTMGMSLSPPMGPEESPMGTPTPSGFGSSPVMPSDMSGMDEVDSGYAFPPIPVTDSAVAEPEPPAPILSPVPQSRYNATPPVPVSQYMATPPIETARTPSPAAMSQRTSASPVPRTVVTPTPPSTSALGQMSFTTPNQAQENGTQNGNGWSAVPGDPSTWTVEQVVAWAMGKGFDDMVCHKFMEHEITGDVLLEMDAHTLKEIDIIQFGKRVKIANAINELRRPGSMRSVGPASMRSQQMSPAYSSHHRAPSITAVYPTSPGYGPEYQQPQTQQHSRAASMSGPVDTIPEHEAYQPQQRSDAAALGFNQPTTPSASSPVPQTHDYADWNTSRKSSANVSQHESRSYAPIREEDESHQAIAAGQTPDPPLSSTFASAMSQPTTAVGSPLNRTGSMHSKASSIPPTPTTPSTRRGSAEQRPSSAFGHRKARSSIDGSTTSRATGERMSNLLSGALSRNRKPAPRFPSSTSAQNLDQMTNETGGGLSRFMGGHSKKISKGSTPSTMTKASSTNPQRISVGTPMPTSPNNRTGGLAAAGGASALSKIGTPDFTGFLKKKGDRYNTWKTRYFVLKGARLYYLRNEREEKLKGHIDLGGYKVMTDSNASSGNYGFQLVHDRDKTHHFSSSDPRAVKEWMKMLMKATITRDFSAPVISSCNIHTIPLREAQAMAPRPPSPTSMQATQRAARRDNPNQLTARDASVLMEFDKEKGNHMSVLPVETGSRSAINDLGYGAPPRPSREQRRPSTMDKGRNASLASYYPDEEAPVNMAPPVPVPAIPEQYRQPAQPAQPVVTIAQPSQKGTEDLLAWINANLPPNTERATSIPASFISGKLICRIIEHLAGPTSVAGSIPAKDSLFESIGGEPNLEGIFCAFDKCIDENVDINGISINDIRSGDGERVTLLLENLRKWGEQRRAGM